MGRRLTLAILLSLFCMPFLKADPYYAAIELLYFKPTIDQSYYAITSSRNVFKTPTKDPEFFPNGTRHNNDPDFHVGFRIETMFQPSAMCNGLDLRFAYYNHAHTSRLNGEFIFDTSVFPGSGAARPEDLPYTGSTRYKEHFKYYAFDATFNRLTINCCPENLTFLLGLHFAYIQLNERQNSSGFSTLLISPFNQEAFFNNLHRNSNFWGLGPQLGFDYQYFFPQCCAGNFGIRTDVRASLLATHTRAKLSNISNHTGPVGAHIRNQPSWRINPCADVKLGVTYNYPFCFCNATFELGYELLWYSNCIDAITGFDPAFAGVGMDLFSNLSLQGPYFAIGASF